MGSKPLSGLVPPLISKADRDPVALKSPEFLDEPIFLLTLPFAGQKLYDLLSPVNKLQTIAPLAIGSIGLRYLFRILAIPGVFREADLLNSAFSVKGRKWGSGHWKIRLWFGNGSRADPIAGSVSLMRV